MLSLLPEVVRPGQSGSTSLSDAASRRVAGQSFGSFARIFAHVCAQGATEGALGGQPLSVTSS